MYSFRERVNFVCGRTFGLNPASKPHPLARERLNERLEAKHASEKSQKGCLSFIIVLEDVEVIFVNTPFRTEFAADYGNAFCNSI
jgi:hypothetical protein